MNKREKPSCPHCGQIMRYVRHGVRLTARKAKIFDAIQRAKDEGLSASDIIEALRLESTESCIRAHVFQINEILQRMGSPLRITGRKKRFRLVPKREIALANEKRI